MRVGCLQFAPEVGDVNNNITRADAILNQANPENLDLLVLPELAFTGYNFKSLQQISPFLEPRESGISALWARDTALRLDCVVTVGYPEKVDIQSKWPTSPEYYNSVLAVNRDGETVAHYRKTFLYYTDETWALEGSEGFYSGFVPELGATTSMGICMDINPYKFEAPWHAFEFAFHCLEVEANLVILTMAWNTREEASSFSCVPEEPDMNSLTYWISRLEPMIRSETRDEIIVIFCNRAGIETDAVYAGTSAVIGIRDGEVNVYGILGRGVEDVLVVDTESPPYAKVVYRPDDQASTATPIDESTFDAKATEQGGDGPIPGARTPSVQTTQMDNSTGPSSIDVDRRQTQHQVFPTAGYDSGISTISNCLAQPQDLPAARRCNTKRTSTHSKSRSLPAQISSLFNPFTGHNESSPQSPMLSARPHSNTLLSAPISSRASAIARADSPTLSMEYPIVSPVSPRAWNTGSCHRESQHSRNGARLDRPQSLATYNEGYKRHKKLDSGICLSVASSDPKSLPEPKESGCGSPDWPIGGTEDEDEIVEIIVQRSSTCQIHGLSQRESNTTFQPTDPPIAPLVTPFTGPLGHAVQAMGKDLTIEPQCA
ncbi:carbon-nitrogen hydrolase [Astrocystis sublimbata]|nr:carbon-nitrogen hydrolase [Astrocystis sublimbata]